MNDPVERILPTATVTVGVIAAAVVVGFLLGVPEPTTTASTPAPTKLVVLVVFDQLRADLISRPEWRQHFGPDGFRRLQERGAWFTDCHYPYATTTTGPGHASMLTGAPPAVTGIINNEWYDRGAKSDVYCAGESRFELVPHAPPVEPGETASTRTIRYAGAPTRLLALTVADVLKEATGGRGKVFGVSLKDRSALLPSGKRPDGAFWFDGRFVTSTYYADAVPEWVAAFNASGKADAYFGKDWVRVRPDLDYDTLAGPDKGEGEGGGTGQGQTFPHPMTGGKDKDGRPFASPKAAGAKYYEALATSPFGNELLLDFARTCIDAEQLGADDVPDLLTVSFSSNDLVGHAWGPDSHEVLDCTLRSDAVLAELLAHLDAKVGKGRYAVVLTADHGICPLPEFAVTHPDRYPDAKGAKRVPGLGLLVLAEQHLRDKFGKPTEKAEPKDKSKGWIEQPSPPYLYLNRKLANERGVKVEAVAEELANWLVDQDGVQAAYTHARLSKPVESVDPIEGRVRLSFHPDRSGDVYLLLKSYHLITSPTSTSRIFTGTTHGAPHPYDTHVPLLVYGPGVGGGPRAEHVTPLHAAPIAAHFLGVPPPAKATYPLPKSLAQ
jgi:predicted AlkP superfamily pyrophosphatase or phosphodiesterase